MIYPYVNFTSILSTRLSLTRKFLRHIKSKYKGLRVYITVEDFFEAGKRRGMQEINCKIKRGPELNNPRYFQPGLYRDTRTR